MRLFDRLFRKKNIPEHDKGSLLDHYELLTLMIRHSPIYAFVKDVSADGSRVVFASDNYKDMIGIAGADMVGKSMEELFPAELAASITADDRDVVAKGQVLRVSEAHNGRHYDTIKFPLLTRTKTFLAGYTMDVTEQKQNEDRVKSLLEEKELILKEVHHRIKNNMNVVDALLTLQADASKDPTVIAALEDAGNRIQSMMVLYDKLYQTDGCKEVSLKEYLPSLLAQIIKNFPKAGLIHVETHVDKIILDAKRTSSLGIIVNELVTNVMKYAFKDVADATINVTATTEDGIILLTIDDNGKGMPESIDFEHSEGFGLSLVDMMTKHLKGTIRIERGKGTKIVLQFPL